MNRFRTSLFALALIATTLFAPHAVWALDKSATHTEMMTLANQIRQWKPLVADPGIASQLAAASARYGQLSALMGGDAPAAVEAGAPGVDGSSDWAPEGASMGVIPQAPPGCTSPGTLTVTQSTPTVIADVAVSTSTLVVAGAGPFLWDLNLRTFITHTFAADMDITLESPAGTVVTLSTDNGAGNDDVFNGTIWDDQANPGGQVPYVTNNGLASDHAYVNATLASPLVPEEAMGAFVGEDPNGTWTITISDDLSGDTGSLDSWTLELSTYPTPPIVSSTAATQSTPTPIADVAVSTSTLVIAGAGTSILDVDLTATITHTFAADMDITIESPSGTVVTLSTDNGAGNDDVFNGTTWNDDANPAGQVPYSSNNGVTTDHLYANLTLANPLVAEEAMAAFQGEDPNGTWTLTVSDDLSGDTGTIVEWSLDIDTATCVVPDTDLAVTKSGAAAGDQITWTITATNNGPDDATGVVVTDTLDACTTFLSDDCGAANVPPWTWNVGNLANGASAVCNVTVDASACPVGSVSNTASIAGDQNDPNPSNDSGSASVGVGSILEVPTASAIGLAALALLLAGAAFVVLRRS